MSKIKLLQLKKLLKELEYIESDFEYRSELISEADNEFIKSINNFLDEHPDIKDIYDKKINEKINQSIKNNQESTSTTEEIEVTQNIQEEEETIYESIIDNMVSDLVETNVKLKKLYREIVKLTHPDKIKKQTLNDLYIKATEFYNFNDKIGIYRICSELNIDYDIDDDDEIFISERIDSLKKRISFLESTFTYKWFESESEDEKNKIMVEYIKLRIN
jgi:predicted RNA-binding protein with RPS1 domain